MSDANTVIDDAVRVLTTRVPIEVILLVGSYARGDETPESDIDLVILTHKASELVSEPAWTEAMGRTKAITSEDWGAITSLRVFYDHFEIEYGIGEPSWLALPLDAGTERVLRDGYKVIYQNGSVMKAVATYLERRGP